MKTDYALAVESLLGVAQYGCASTYNDLVRTWTDNRPIPTQAELDTAFTQLSEDVAIEAGLQGLYEIESNNLIWRAVKENNILTGKHLEKLNEKIKVK